MSHKITANNLALDAMATDAGDALRSDLEADLLVLAWKGNTTQLGLRGYSDQYPDTKRTYCVLLHLKRLRFVIREAPLRWTLTHTGRVHLALWRKERREAQAA
jgi:hypothetical protein